MMKPYTAETHLGRVKALDDIHHRTADGGKANRAATAKAQRHAARQDGNRAAKVGADEAAIERHNAIVEADSRGIMRQSLLIDGLAPIVTTEKT